MTGQEFDLKRLYAVKGLPHLWVFGAVLKNGSWVLKHAKTGHKQIIHDRSKIQPFEHMAIHMEDGSKKPLEEVLNKLFEMEEAGITIPKDLTQPPENVLNEPFAGKIMKAVIPGYDPNEFKPYHMETILKWFHEVCEVIENMEE